MPFESKAQVRYMFAKHPALAKEFAAKTKSMAALPDHKKGAKVKKDRKPVMPRTA